MIWNTAGDANSPNEPLFSDIIPLWPIPTSLKTEHFYPIARQKRGWVVTPIARCYFWSGRRYHAEHTILHDGCASVNNRCSHSLAPTSPLYVIMIKLLYRIITYEDTHHLRGSFQAVVDNSTLARSAVLSFPPMLRSCSADNYRDKNKCEQNSFLHFHTLTYNNSTDVESILDSQSDENNASVLRPVKLGHDFPTTDEYIPRADQSPSTVIYR